MKFSSLFILFEFSFPIRLHLLDLLHVLGLSHCFLTVVVD
jgi:hypothetical protein